MWSFNAGPYNSQATVRPNSTGRGWGRVAMSMAAALTFVGVALCAGWVLMKVLV